MRWVLIGILFLAASVAKIDAFKLGRSQPTERISGQFYPPSLFFFSFFSFHGSFSLVEEYGLDNFGFSLLIKN